MSNEEVLGTIEILGNLENQATAFKDFYEKAKLIGANAYYYTESLDLNNKPIESGAKKIQLYFVPELPIQKNSYRVFNFGKMKTFVVNGQKIKLPAFSFMKFKLQKGEDNYISTAKLFRK